MGFPYNIPFKENTHTIHRNMFLSSPLKTLDSHLWVDLMATEKYYYQFEPFITEDG
jgi:hypothetical protein